MSKLVVGIIFLIAVVIIYDRNSSPSCLDDLEQFTYEGEICESRKVLPSDCETPLLKAKIAGLECKKLGISENQIFAAINLGSAKTGKLPTSPYERIKSVIESEPFYLKTTLDNFIPFSSKCILSETKLYQVIGYSIKSSNAQFFSYELGGHCCSISEIDDQLPILTESQINELNSNQMKGFLSRPYYKNVKVHTSKSVDTIVKVFNEKTK